MPRWPKADLTGARAKVGRAKEHFESLKVELDRWSANDANRGLFHRRIEGKWNVVSHSPLPEPDPHWALIAGDYINNLRSALDYAIWQLVLREGKAGTNWHSWPIFKSRQDWENKLKLRKRSPERGPLFGIPPNGKAWAVIEKSQPFNNANPEIHWLAVLQRLSNHDKHRTLHLQESVPEIDGIAGIKDFLSWGPESIWHEFRIWKGPLSTETETELFRVSFRSGPQPRLKVQSRLLLEHSFGDGEGQLPFNPLFQLRWHVERTLNQLAKLPRVVGW